VTDFVTWAAGRNPDLNTIFTSYSDELGITANLRFQRILELPVYRKIWGNTRLASSEDEGRWQRNTSVCEYVGHKGAFRVTTVNGQITGHGLDIGVVDDTVIIQRWADKVLDELLSSVEVYEDSKRVKTPLSLT
jgi:hypothetical protein